MLPSSSRNDYKPSVSWNWTPRLIDPRYGSMMTGLAFLTPLWEGNGDMWDVAANLKITADSQTIWTTGPVGASLTRGLSSSQTLGTSATGSSPLTTSDGAGTGDFTMLVLANVAARASRQDILDVGENGGSFTSAFLIANVNTAISATSGSMLFGTYNAGAQGVAAAGAVDGQVHCYIGRRSGTTMTLWKDGVIVAGPTTVTAQQITNANGSVFFGNSNGSLWLGDNLYLTGGWNRALTDGECELAGINPWGLVAQIRTYSTTPASFVQTLGINEQTIRGYQRDQSGALNLTTDGTLVPISGTAGDTSLLTSGLTVNINKVSGGVKKTAALGNFTATDSTHWTGDVYVPVGSMLLGNVADPVSGVVSGNQSNQWTVGCRYIFGGQSNTVNYYGVGPSGQNVDNNVAVFNGTNNTWYVGNTSFFGLGNAYGLGQFFNSMRAGFVAADPTNEVAIIACTVGAGNTYVTDWLQGNATWTTANATINNSQFGPKFEAVYWNLGDNDSLDTKTPQTYFDVATRAVFAQFQSLAGRGNSTMKIGVEIIGAHFNPTGVGDISDANIDFVRSTLYNIATTHPGCYLLASTEDMILAAADPNHWNGNQYQKLGYRDGNSTLKAAYGLNTGVGIGPVIASAAYSGNLVQLSVTQNGGSALKTGNGTTSGAGIWGLQVFANSVAQTILSTDVSGNTINVHCQGGTLAAPVQVQYASGHQPWGSNWTDGGSDTTNGIVYDNQTIGNASINNTGLPLISTFGNIAATQSGGSVVVTRSKMPARTGSRSYY